MLDEPSRPLDGLRVVDLSTSYAGPTATMYLADLGADVIKVERAGGDDARAWGPPFLADGTSAWFVSANRNKRSIRLDLRTEPDRRFLFELLADADVFVETLNPAKLHQLGIDPDTLRARFPRLVYCAISGYGLDGPDAELPGYDLVAQARSGMMSVTGAAGGDPQRVSTALSDVVAGMVAVMGILAAVRRQDRTGQGDVVDVSLLESDLALMAPRIASFLAGEPEPQPSGATDSVIALYQAFPTADRPIAIAAGNDAIWQRLCAALDLDDLAADPQLDSNAARRVHRPRVVAAVTAALATAPAAVWLDRLRRAGVPAAPVQGLADVVVDPQVVARRAITTIDQPGIGPVQVVASPVHLHSMGRNVTHRPAPDCGQHEAEVRAATTIDVRPSAPDSAALPATGAAR